MTTDAETYRWSTVAATEAYDAAASVIHPYYAEVQDQILDSLPFKGRATFDALDLGGGSGRLAERILARFPGARVTIVDQSEPFLALAERRLRRFSSRARLLQRRLQDDWRSVLHSPPHVIVSTSAIHHLAPREKQSLFKQCYEALAPGGLFINGDEIRPTDDAEYFALLQQWSVHMRAAIADGRIPESFRATLDQWYDRNLERFGQPKNSGDDCTEPIESQAVYLSQVGFSDVSVKWSTKLWAVLAARK